MDILPVIILVAFVIIFYTLTYHSLIRTRSLILDAAEQTDLLIDARNKLIVELIQLQHHQREGDQNKWLALIENYEILQAAPKDELQQRIDANDKITHSLYELFNVPHQTLAIAANPVLHKSQTDLTTINNKIINSVETYNSIINYYNQKISLFPARYIARHYKFKPYPLVIIPKSETEKFILY